MRILRTTAKRRLLLSALLGVTMLCAWAVTAQASSALYGGLGSVGELHAIPIFPESEPEGDAVVVEGEHAFAVDPTDGSYYIGDLFENEKGPFIRVQKFEASGKFVAEGRIPATESNEFDGFAIDPEEHRLYLLVVETAARELWSISTETLKARRLDTAKDLHASETKRVALLEPKGITVDPVTHDVLIVGQENEPTKEEPERMVAAVQRVHTTGDDKLGPRYVDRENCLVGGEEEHPTVEAPCSEDPEATFSAAASPGGKLYTERGFTEIWEIPSSEGANEVFEGATKPKEYASSPKRLFALSGGQHILQFALNQEFGDTMTITHGPAGTRIYLAAEANTGQGSAAAALILGYDESGAGGAPEAHVIGWTGGLTESEKLSNPNCVVPESASAPLIGADGEERTLLFVTVPADEFTHTPESARVMRFGSGAGAAQCAHASATPPKVTFEGREVKTPPPLPIGKEVSISSEVTGANAESVEWKLKNTTTGKEETVPPSGYEFQTPTLLRKFTESGAYEIKEIILPDDFGPPIEEKTSSAIVVGEPLVTVKISRETSITSGKATTFTAHVEDLNEAPAQLKYVWEFGDGEKAEGSATGLTFATPHTYTHEGNYTVQLTITDGGKRVAKASQSVPVSAEPAKPPSTTTSGTTTSGGGAPASEAPKTEVLPAKEASDPDAELAGSSLSVSPNGTLAVKVTCPVGQTSCTGTITLRTLSAVSAGAHKRKAVLTLASASFSVAGGQVKAVTLHLSTQARALLAHSHVLRARTTLVAHDPAGASHTAQVVVTLRPAPRKHHKH